MNTSTIVQKNAPPVARDPAIVLIDPKNPHNVGMAMRLASVYRFPQLFYTGDRVRMELKNRKRLPREERMKHWQNVDVVEYDRPLELFSREVVPVCIEVRKNAEKLPDFVHPPRAVYVFGPEDGSVPQPVLAACHRFVIIPLPSCLNLATAIATVLYDRAVKLGGFGDFETASD